MVSNLKHVIHTVKYVQLSTGIALLGSNSDMNEERALTLENSITDIYSNSWGPFDSGDIVEGPGRLTKLALQNGVREVCTISCFPKLAVRKHIYPQFPVGS